MASHELGVYAIGKDTGKVTLEIVTHLRFYLDKRTDVKTESSAQSHIVDVRSGAAEVEIISEGANFNVIALSKQWSCAKQHTNNCD